MVIGPVTVRVMECSHVFGPFVQCSTDQVPMVQWSNIPFPLFESLLGLVYVSIKFQPCFFSHLPGEGC